MGGEALYERYKDALKRGHVASLRGQLEAALEAYMEAARIAPERPTPHTAAGTALLRRKRPGEALRAYEVALRIMPRDETALLGRAQALAALERRAEAADAFDSLAEHRAVGGKLADAVDAARRGLELAEGRDRRRTLERLIDRLRASEPGEPGRLALERALRVLEGPAVAARPRPRPAPPPTPEAIEASATAEAAMEAADEAPAPGRTEAPAEPTAPAESTPPAGSTPAAADAHGGDGSAAAAASRREEPAWPEADMRRVRELAAARNAARLEAMQAPPEPERPDLAWPEPGVGAARHHDPATPRVEAGAASLEGVGDEVAAVDTDAPPAVDATLDGPEAAEPASAGAFDGRPSLDAPPGDGHAAYATADMAAATDAAVDEGEPGDGAATEPDPDAAVDEDAGALAEASVDADGQPADLDDVPRDSTVAAAEDLLVSPHDDAEAASVASEAGAPVDASADDGDLALGRDAWPMAAEQVAIRARRSRRGSGHARAAEDATGDEPRDRGAVDGEPPAEVVARTGSSVDAGPAMQRPAALERATGIDSSTDAPPSTEAAPDSTGDAESTAEAESTADAEPATRTGSAGDDAPTPKGVAVRAALDRAVPDVATAEDLARLAEDALDRGDPETALGRLLDLAAVHHRAGHGAAAIDACYLALSIRPDDVDLHLALAQLYDDRGWAPLAGEKLDLLDRLVGLGDDLEGSARVAAARSARA